MFDEQHGFRETGNVFHSKRIMTQARELNMQKGWRNPSSPLACATIMSSVFGLAFVADTLVQGLALDGFVDGDVGPFEHAG